MLSELTDDGKKTTLIKQSPNGLTIKSDQYEDKGTEEYPIRMYTSEEEIVFITTEKEERQIIYVRFNSR